MGVETEVVSMEEFIDQTLGGVSRQLGKAVVAVIIMSMCLVALIIILFFNLQAAKEYSQVAIMKAIGFSVQDIRKQYLLKVLMVSMIGIVFGTVLANALGEGIVIGILSILGLGISKITFIINPVNAYLLCPIATLIVAVAVTWYSSKAFKRYNIVQLINE